MKYAGLRCVQLATIGGFGTSKYEGVAAIGRPGNLVNGTARLSSAIADNAGWYEV